MLFGSLFLLAHSTAGRIRMLGSTRAGRQCVSRHDAERGDLLGAFSYDLVRERPIPAPGR